MPLGKETFYLTPDAILVTAGKTVAEFGYEDVEFMFRSARFIEEETPPADATVVDQTWRYVNRKGGPDRRSTTTGNYRSAYMVKSIFARPTE